MYFKFDLLIDTHTHLYVEAFDKDRDLTIQNAISKGVTDFYIPAIDSKYHQRMFDLEKNYSRSSSNFLSRIAYDNIKFAMIQPYSKSRDKRFSNITLFPFNSVDRSSYKSSNLISESFPFSYKPISLVFKKMCNG